jgi:hypothetical protein
MSDQSNQPSESHPQPSESEHGRQEGGQREQGVRTEHPSDLSSPQVTTPPDEGRGEQERGARAR